MENEITVSKFNELSETLQHEMLWRNGFIVSKRKEGDYEIICYRIFDFCVELYYNIKRNFFKELKSYECPDAKCV